MRRVATALLLTALGLAATSGARAQSGGKIPVTEDLRRQERLDARIERRAGRPDALPGAAAPPVQSDPSGVAGFNGPPGPIGDSVNSFGALPQGAAGSDIR